MTADIIPFPAAAARRQRSSVSCDWLFFAAAFGAGFCCGVLAATGMLPWMFAPLPRR